MAVQDDAREIEMIDLFELRGANEGRSGTDAYLDYGGQTLPFELKSTSKGSVTTVRDFGPDHIEKWRNRHWLIGVYDARGTKILHALYGSPAAMAPWIDEKAEYIRPDFEFAESVPGLITSDVMNLVVGAKELYDYDDARTLQKKQHSKAEYLALMDRDAGYSPDRMLEIVRSRVKYLIERGSTLNNPHIPASYFAGWEKIKENHARRLRELVREALDLRA